MTARSPALVLVLVAGTGAAGADPCPAGATCPAPAEPEVRFRRGAGFFISLEASSVIAVTSGAQSPDVESVTLLSGRASLSYGAPRIRYFAALDLSLGATVNDGGFAAEATVFPIGIGVQLRHPERTMFFGVAAGIGVSAAPPALPTVGMLPLQLVSIVRLTDKLNLHVRARASRAINRTSRDDGARSSSLYDELDSTVALQLSQFHNYLEGRYFGVAYRELDDARFIGLVVGSGGGEEVFDEK